MSNVYQNIFRGTISNSLLNFSNSPILWEIFNLLPKYWKFLKAPAGLVAISCGILAGSTIWLVFWFPKSVKAFEKSYQNWKKSQTRTSFQVLINNSSWLYRFFNIFIVKQLKQLHKTEKTSFLSLSFLSPEISPPGKN